MNAHEHQRNCSIIYFEIAVIQKWINSMIASLSLSGTSFAIATATNAAIPIRITITAMTNCYCCYCLIVADSAMHSAPPLQMIILSLNHSSEYPL